VPISRINNLAYWDRLLAQDFAQLVRQRQPAQLDPWLARAAVSPLLPLQRFAKGLRDDYDAVKAGVTLPWSSGPVEGHINRLVVFQICTLAVRYAILVLS
jgi:transposase